MSNWADKGSQEGIRVERRRLLTCLGLISQFSVKSEVTLAIVLRDQFFLAWFGKSRSDRKSSCSFVKFLTDDARTKMFLLKLASGTHQEVLYLLLCKSKLWMHELVFWAHQPIWRTPTDYHVSSRKIIRSKTEKGNRAKTEERWTNYSVMSVLSHSDWSRIVTGHCNVIWNAIGI